MARPVTRWRGAGRTTGRRVHYAYVMRCSWPSNTPASIGVTVLTSLQFGTVRHRGDPHVLAAGNVDVARLAGAVRDRRRSAARGPGRSQSPIDLAVLGLADLPVGPVLIHQVSKDVWDRDGSLT